MLRKETILTGNQIKINRFLVKQTHTHTTVPQTQDNNKQKIYLMENRK